MENDLFQIFVLHCPAQQSWPGRSPSPTSWLPLSPRFEAIHHELNKATAQNKDLQWEMELLQSELTELRTTQAKTAKESEKYKEERDAVYSEYKLIMSERDQVHIHLERERNQGAGEEGVRERERKRRGEIILRNWLTRL